METIKKRFLKPKSRRITIIFLIIFMLFMTLEAFAILEQKNLNQYINKGNLATDYTYLAVEDKYNTPTYTTNKKKYLQNGIPDSQAEKTIPVTDLVGLKVNDTHSLYGEYIRDYEFSSEVIYFDDDHSFSFLNTSTASGLYYLAFDYLDLSKNVENSKINLTINGDNPFYESKSLLISSLWEYDTQDFALDRYGNELQPRSHKLPTWLNYQVRDYQGFHPGLYAFELHPGDEVSFSLIDGEMLIGQVYFIKNQVLKSYSEYLTAFPDEKPVKSLLRYSARGMKTRNDPSIRLRTEDDPSSIYYDAGSLMLNVIFGDSYQNGGQKIDYEIEVPQDGFYNLSFKYRQYIIRDLPTFRNIYVDGEIPFEDLEAYPFPYTTKFLNRTLMNQNGEPLKIYLTKGTHLLSFEAVLYPYRVAIETLQRIMGEIQSLALKIKRYTSGGTDQYRDWDINVYFPEAHDLLLNWAEQLNGLYEKLVTLGTNINPTEISNLLVSETRLKKMAKNINKLPVLMNQFADGDSSIVQLLGSMVQNFMRAGLEFERFMIHGQTRLDHPQAHFFLRGYENVKKLILSFVKQDYRAHARKEGDLVVWVNHSRQYIEIMQQMIDAEYTGDLNIILSQMPDQNRLILANASETSPDVAIGVDHWIPYDFAIRDASLDLRQFDGYAELVTHFSKGAFLPYIFEDGVYGFPETQNFWLTFYRKDILEAIGIDHIPQTWNEIIGILPLLQSYGMNYFMPLSQYSGLKPFVATLPFITQFGGELYSADGMSTAIYSENTLKGMKLMSDLFILYNIQKFVASFYNNFRYGTMPIGISDLGTYLLLRNAAVELDGLWGMDLHPGYQEEPGDEIIRFSPAGAQANMIISRTEYPQESWDFLSWWMATDTQTEFAFNLQSTYGKAYFWNTANLDAFAQLSMPKEYKDIVLAQWDYALEAARIPGTTMVEREISNAWTEIVFNGANPRQALDQAVRLANREILYKMEEFGYVKNGVMIKPYPVPNINNIDYWLREN